MAKNAAAFVWFVIVLSLLQGQVAIAASPWRFWTKADGLPESVVFGLTSDNAGHIAVKFGAVPSIALLDGYQISQLPSPHAYGRFLSAPDKGLWTFNAAGIDVHDSLGWHQYANREISDFAKTRPMLQTPWFMYSVYRGPEDRMDVVPMGNNSAIILFSDRLVEWDRTTGGRRVIRTAAHTRLLRFRDIQPAGTGFWVTGEKGLGHLQRVKDGFEWSEFPAPAERTDLVNPIEGAAGEVFASALRPDGKRSLLRFSGGVWDEVFVGGRGQLKGWRGPENEIWLQNGRKIVQLDAAQTGDLGGGQVITGLTTAVVSLRGESFWLGTTEGVARYSPPLWRTPPELEWANTAVSAIAEDRQDRIWFVSGQYLAVNDHGTWRRFHLPTGRAAPLLTDNIVVLGNGDLAIRGNSLADIIVFSPASGKFHVTSHPAGKRIGMLAERRGGTAWVQVFDSDSSRWRLEIFDGTHFLPGNQPVFTTLNDLRVILEAAHGDLWLGSTDSLARIRQGHIQFPGTKEGFADTAVFSAAEAPDGTIMLGGRESITAFDGHSFRILKKVDQADSISLGSNGVIWAGSGSGIHRYDAGQWITNTVEDGLPTTAIRKVYRDSKGRVWAGTTHGISLFYPEADRDPPVTNIVDDQNLRETPPGGEVRLVFSGGDKWKFTSADRLSFSWRLDNSAWSDFGPSHFASFKQLHSGQHRFEVRAMDRNGNIDPFPAKYQFSVLLPWYLQTEFLVLAGIALFIIANLSRRAGRHHRRVAFQSRHDPLTGLSNRMVLESSFQQAIADARSKGNAVAILLLDLDRFKPINDTLGHLVGDRFLQEVSKRLQSVVRKEDTLARLGGDEFAILMPDIHLPLEVEALARRILALLRLPYQIDSFELAGSASIGISLFPLHGEDAATLQRLADMAMYQCKARNKDGYAVFDPQVNGLDFRSAEMAGLIREALDKNHFSLAYQPFRNIDGELAGFEALIRLEHPEFGTIQPGDFISIAENTGLIVRVGNWVLGEACHQMARMHADGYRQLRINVNVSTVQLARPDFADTVRGVLLETALDPSALTLEITETTMMRSWKESLPQIEELRSLGISIALDDFGTGYSTLSALHLLPVDYIKIDRSFTWRLNDQSGDGLILIQAITDLVHRFGFEVVAEGVETAQQLSDLKSIGCDIFQGYLLGRPMSVERVRGLLESEQGHLRGNSSADLQALVRV